MNDRDFEAYIKEKLYDLTEPVEPGNWETFLAIQRGRKRKKMIYRYFVYSTAVAAAVLLFLLLQPPTATLPDSAGEPVGTLSENIPAALDSVPTMQPSDSLYHREQKPPHAEPIRIIQSDTPLLAVATDINEETVELPVIIYDPDISEKEELPDPIIFYDNPPEVSLHKRHAVSEGWSISVSSSYSSAVGEAPFSPTVQTMTGRTRMFSTQNVYNYQESDVLSFFPPMSIGLNFQKELYTWLSVGVGVNYTLLQSKYSNSYHYIGEEYTIRQSLHYVGLPVAALVHFIHQPKWHVYASAGGMVEKAVTAYSSASSRFSDNSESTYVKGLQWSVQAGLGVEVWLSPMLGVYLEPGVGYFFDCKQPRSIRTVQPTQFKAEVGLRVRI